MPDIGTIQKFSQVDLSAPTDVSELDGLIEKLKGMEARYTAEGEKKLALEKAADMEDIDKYVDEQIKAE